MQWPHRADGVECRVGPHAEVRARHVVGDRGGDDHKWDAELIELLPALHQLQAPCVGLRREQQGGVRERERWEGKRSSRGAHLKAPDDDEALNVELRDVGADLFEALFG